MLAALDRLTIAVIDWPDDVLAGAIAVVEDDLRLTVAVSVEQLPDMGEAVPLRRILQRHLDDVVADYIQVARVLSAQRISHVGHAITLVGNQPGRVTARVDDSATRIVERQTQTKGLPLFHLGDAVENLLRGEQIEPAELVVGAPIAPGRAWWPPFPAWVLRHLHATLTNFCKLLRPGGSSSPLARTRRPQLVNDTSPT